MLDIILCTFGLIVFVIMVAGFAGLPIYLTIRDWNEIVADWKKFLFKS